MFSFRSVEITDSPKSGSGAVRSKLQLDVLMEMNEFLPAICAALRSVFE